MMNWLAWFLASAVALLAGPFVPAQPRAFVFAASLSCAGALHCDGPPGDLSVLFDARRVPAAPALGPAAEVRARAAQRTAPRILSPADLQPASAQGAEVGATVRVGGRLFLVTARRTMVASAYTTGEPGVGTVTATGTRARVGEAAVDPRVIPLGSWMYVTGYRSRALPAAGILEHAEDVGGAIKGNRVDLFADASFAALAEFGLQQVTVYLLEPLPDAPATATADTPL
jgi:3D (Asp-Asp-Asp) domain-containing protein